MFKTLFARCYMCSRVFQLSPLLHPRRNFTSQEASSALRPFYFIVHPDLFGQHPRERAVNEHSLKLLNEFLSSHKTNTSGIKASEIVFYIRSHDGSKSYMRPVKISLTRKDLRDTVVAVLSSCGLSSDHVPKPSSLIYGTNRPIDWHPSYYEATGQENPNKKKAESPTRPPVLTLRGWLKQNMARAKQRQSSMEYIHDDIATMVTSLKFNLALKDIRFDHVWSRQHFRGCLKSFYRLYNNHPQFLEYVLRDKVLVFSNGSGVNRLGEIVLSSEDVAQTWITALKSVPAYDAVLNRLPIMEKSLSSLLNNIKVVRLETSSGSVMASEYELLVNKLLNSLRRSQDYVKASFRDEDLSMLQLAVEGEMSPLTLSSSGQFLIPASVPASLVVDCVHKNKNKALDVLEKSQREVLEEKQWHSEVVKLLGLREMRKDQSVEPGHMLDCYRRLFEEEDRFGLSLAGSHLCVSHYYSVLQDGTVCIPWNWQGHDDY